MTHMVSRVRWLAVEMRRYLVAPVTLCAVALVCLVFVVQRFSGTWYADVTNLQHGLAFSVAEVARGQWWRSVSANLVNGPTRPDVWIPGLTHLVNNVVGLLAFGPTVERAIGRARYVIVLLIGGAVAYGWLMVFTPEAFFPDGTSGTLFAVIGALFAHVVLHPPKRILEWIGVAVVALAALAGFIGRPAITVQIHAGGLAAGFVLGLFFDRRRGRRVVVAAAAGVTLCLLALVAVRSHQLGETDPRVERTAVVGPLQSAVSVAAGDAVVTSGYPASVVVAGRWRAALPAAPDAVTGAGRTVWVTTVDGDLLAFSDGGRRLGRVKIGPLPHALAYDGTAVWAASRGRLHRVDPASMRVTDVVRTGASSYAAHVAAGAVCVSDLDHPSVVCVDVRTRRPRRIPVGLRSWTLGGDGRRRLYVSEDRTLVAVDVPTGKRIGRTRLPGPAYHLVAGADGRVWAADFRERRLIGVSSDASRLIDEIRLGVASPARLAVNGRYILVADFAGHRLLRVRT